MLYYCIHLLDYILLERTQKMKDYEKLIEDKYERFSSSKKKYAVLKISTPLPKAEIIYHSWFS